MRTSICMYIIIIYRLININYICMYLLWVYYICMYKHKDKLAWFHQPLAMVRDQYGASCPFFCWASCWRIWLTRLKICKNKFSINIININVCMRTSICRYIIIIYRLININYICMYLLWVYYICMYKHKDKLILSEYIFNL